MRKIFLVIAIIFTIIGIIFACLPLGTIAILPIGVALLSGFLALKKSETHQQKFIKVLLLLSIISLIAVVAKEVLVKDEVVKDVQFEKVKIESKKEDKKDLEELENDLE